MSDSVSEISCPDYEGRWCEMSNRAVFRITGPDRVRFLNGQLTNDVAGPLEKSAIAACLCSLKGKTEALVWVSSFDGALILDGELSQREQLLTRLDRYLIADDCEIEDVTGQLRLIHHFIAGAGGVESRRSKNAGHDLWLSAEAAIPLEPNDRISEDDFDLIQLLSLIPLSGREITGAEFPAELGLDAWAVDFHKGCYLGQEIVSRIESVGRVNKSLRLVRSQRPFSQGDAILIEGEISGVVTRASRELGEAEFITMALCKISPDPGNRYALNSASGVS